MLTADQTFSLGTQVAAPLDRRQRNFWIAFACALLLHGGLILELNRSAHEATLGDESGSADAISVELVTEADLAKRSSDVAPASPPPGQPAPTPTPTPPAPTPPAPTPPVETPTPPAPAEPAQPPQPETPQPSETKVQPQEQTSPAPETPTPAPEQKSLVPDLATEFPDLPSLQEPKQTPKAEATPEKAEPAKKAEPPAKPKRPTPDQLALSPPRTSPGGSPSRSSSFSRPPGITRSGQNDDFARGVIRALRQTMPPPRGIFGRVTVRLFLNDNGDLAEVRVIESSGIGGLDQSVVFATKQTNFPLPPYGATVADRTFMISYVYN